MTALAWIPLVLMLVLPAFLPVASAAPMARAAASGPPLTGNITGPSFVGVSLSAKYEVRAMGGPALAANGTYVGTLSYTSSLSGSNTTSATLAPVSGVLVNQSVNLTLSAPNITEALTINVAVTSSLNGTNATTNLTYLVSIIQPYRLSATLYSTTAVTLQEFNITVMLDGAPVGTVTIPTISGKASYPFTFNYVNPGLSMGTHTFTISLAQQHGLVTFAGGAESYSVTFYVGGPPPDYTIDYVLGAVALIGAIFIWLTFVAARRRPRRRK
ncbi:MAG: hypothetical protein WCA77_00345 [Thermoplasmata archaeon]